MKKNSFLILVQFEENNFVKSVSFNICLYICLFYTMRCDEISLLETEENFEILKLFIDVF